MVIIWRLCSKRPLFVKIKYISFIDFGLVTRKPFKIELSGENLVEGSERNKFSIAVTKQENVEAAYLNFADLQEFMKKIFPEEQVALHIEPRREIAPELGTSSSLVIEDNFYEVAEEQLVQFTKGAPEYKYQEIRAREKDFFLKFYIPNIYGNSADLNLYKLYFKGKPQDVEKVIEEFTILMGKTHAYPYLSSRI